MEPQDERLGDYLLRERVDDNGCTETFLGQHFRTEAWVLVKRLKAAYAQAPEFQRLFAQEGRLLRRLASCGVLPFREEGITDHGAFLVFEWSAGLTLGSLIPELARLEEDVRQAFVCQLGLRLAATLHSLHFARDKRTNEELGIIHRGVCPKNVWIGEDGAIRLLNFELCHALVDHEETRLGVVVGVSQYLAPEQLERAGRMEMAEFDHRCDQFALGATLWESVSCRHLFADPNLIRQCQRIQASPASVPAFAEFLAKPSSGLERVIRKALARSPVDRYLSCQALGFELERISESEFSGYSFDAAVRGFVAARWN